MSIRIDGNDDLLLVESNVPTFTGDRAEEKELLRDMGFNQDLINTIYKNMNPVDIQEALDFMNKNERGKFTHSFLINERNVCTICNQGRNAHEGETVFVENNNNDDEEDDVQENNDILDDLFITRRVNSNSNRFRAYEDSYRKSLGKDKNNENIECGICAEVITNPNEVRLKCKHYFCKDCWLDYLKEKISNANVYKIVCMQNGCGVILENQFIKKILEGNQDLIEKYDKFYQRKKMLEQSDKYKFCPFPDCEGYAEKTGKSKYVKCIFGHEFCFECGNEPHGKKKCEDIMDKEFEEWRSHKIVKKCPCCRMWTEKNEGCNHMTCVECKFQWCWLCQKAYSPNHFNEGSCHGLQFYKETDENKIKAKLEENRKRYPGPSKCFICFCTFWKCVGYIFIFFYYYLFSKYEYDLNDFPEAVQVFFVLAFFPMFISFEVSFIIAIIIGTIPCLIYPPLFRKLKFYIRYRIFQ